MCVCVGGRGRDQGREREGGKEGGGGRRGGEKMERREEEAKLLTIRC